MTKRCLIKEYFTEPFVCLGFILFISDILGNFVSLVSDFEGYLFVKFFFYAYYFGAFVFYVMLMTDSLSQIKDKIQIKIKLVYAFLLFLVLLLSVIPPLFDPYIFFSDKLHAINDPNIVLEMKVYAYGVGFMGSPILGIFAKWLIRKQLSRDRIEMPEINYGTVIIISWMFFILLLIIFVTFDTFHICFEKGFCP